MGKTAFFSVGAALATIVAACGSSGSPSGFAGSDGGGQDDSGLIATGDDGGSLFGEGGGGEGGGPTGDPTTCAGAAASHSYIGCDYWPTVTANNVWSVFDYAVVVANAGTTTANITVSGPSSTHQTATVAPGQLTKIYLPWVSVLKGADTDSCGIAAPLAASVLARGAAYHLVSSVPVTVYQFNALEYAGKGGPSGKSWASCPGNQVCPQNGGPIGCFSFSNDASLLLPSTAMTGNYRVTGHGGWQQPGLAMGSYMAITATAASTTVNVKVSSTGDIVAGGGIAATAAGGTLTLTMDAGDVVELVGSGTNASDLSGSLVTASSPVQVITGMPCVDIPLGKSACDHIEESNFPAETLGQDYVVAQPAGPHGRVVGQLVRVYGNFDGTTLTYDPSAPAGCPSTINAGQVVDCGVVSSDFEIKGDHSFAVGLFTQGASVVDPGAGPPNQEGDPDQSLATAVAQFRTKYVFLAPTDYTENYVVVVAPPSASVTLDGTVATTAAKPVGSGAYGVMRLPLGAGQAGAHVLTATAPVGIQVMGYGAYTSYQYPGGLDLQLISPPPLAQ